MRIITGFIGRILLILGPILLFPLALAMLKHEYQCIGPFFFTALGSTVVGLLLYFLRDKRPPSNAQAMLICTFSWVVISLAGAIPFFLVTGYGWLDCFFETMSGFTTTGFTMFNGLDSMPWSIILWRSITEWVGGLGILTFFLAVASQVPGAHRLMVAESHKISSGRPVPGLVHTVKVLWSIYFLLTAAVALGLNLSGMSLFDSINHGMTTIATGGFSPHDSSIGWYAATGTGNFILIEYIIAAGMIAGGTSFLVHYRVFQSRGLKPLWNGSEVKLWWFLIAGFVVVIFAEQLITGRIQAGSIESIFRKDLFQVASITTTTGFGTENLYSPFFGPAARQMFLIMMVIGGCAGSTAGGFKVLRISILIKVASNEVKKIFRADRAITGTRFQGTLLGRSELGRIVTILFLWLIFLAAGTLITSLLAPEMDAITAASGMFSALGNIGPCFMTQDQLMELHWGVKITYIAGMLAGRLEILPLMLLFSRKAWR